MSLTPSSLLLTLRTNWSTSPPSALIWSSISSTAWLAPPCSGPNSALIPAETEANRLACAEPYDLDPVMVKALDQLLILHADHEQNCSTSTVRMVGSAHANLFASVSAGINALFGPLHGGANQAVLEMLDQIKVDGGDVDQFVRKVKSKDEGVKLMGFGHRVYKNYDPRAAIIKKLSLIHI